MYYPEQLRIRKGLMWAAAVIGVVVLGALALSGCRGCSLVDTHGSAAATLAAIGYWASLTAAIFAGIMGTSLACHNDGHLAIAWTKPIGRTAQALGILFIDLLGVLAVFAMTYAATYALESVLSGHPIPIALDANWLMKMARFIAFPIAWLGLTQALSAGLVGGRSGWISGPLWPIAMGLSAATLLPLSAPLTTVLRAINLINPINYFPYWEYDEQIWPKYAFGYGVAVDALALVAIAVVGLIVVTVRWPRVEVE